jgi:hypothetical protein
MQKVMQQVVPLLIHYRSPLVQCHQEHENLDLSALHHYM